MLAQPCENLPGIGSVLAEKLAKCGIFTLQDLLFHLPSRYQDRTHITPIQDLRKNEYAVIAGRVCKVEIKQGKRRTLFCYVEDKTAVIKLRFFHFTTQQVRAFHESVMIRAFGEIREFSDTFEMVHPEYQLLQNEGDCRVEETLTPIYASTLGLSQTRLRQLIKSAQQQCAEAVKTLEWMTAEQLQAQGFQSMAEALTFLHNPPPDTSLQHLEAGKHPALQRLVFDELLAQRLSMQFARESRLLLKAPKLSENKVLIQKFLDSLPFSPTGAQQRVAQEISKDLNSDKPMLRLVQGDVGAGKTLNAAIAALQAIGSGYQVAFMAPTDLLSEQHYLNLHRWLDPLGICVYRLSGKMKIREKRATLVALAENRCQLLIGTHALFQESVKFANLGLIIIDEQHRFGVEQRLSLQQKGIDGEQSPHQLLMTATPIPRTLSMSHFAHLDISILDELPPGRTPVITAILNQGKREPLIARLDQAIASGRQAYWVCTLIEESENLQCMAATVTREQLQTLLPKTRTGLVHGRMKAVEKEAVMADFKAGKLDLLVATTVIEVGVDVPNASLMIIENAERLGLSQLHQLRGRVGRGATQSHCLLLYQSPISQASAERLKILRDTHDGFIIAEKDLLLRGAGEVLGARQTGYRQFKVARLDRDQAILPRLPAFAKKLSTEAPETAKTITQRWLGQFESFLGS